MKISRLNRELRIRPGLLGHGKLHLGSRRDPGVPGVPRGTAGGGDFSQAERGLPGAAGPLAGGGGELLSRHTAPRPTPPLTLLKTSVTLALYCKPLSAVFGFVLFRDFFFFFPLFLPPSPRFFSFKPTQCHL